jgi:hypothetical protein
MAKSLGLEILTDVAIKNWLMERYFGWLDNKSIYTYAYVWPLNKFNAAHMAFDVKSVTAVCTNSCKCWSGVNPTMKIITLLCGYPTSMSCRLGNSMLPMWPMWDCLVHIDSKMERCGLWNGLPICSPIFPC